MQEPEPDLLLGALLIAQHRHPFIDFEDDVIMVLDDLAEQVRGKIPEGAYPMKTLKIISEYLYQDRGFKGNSQDYYAVDNSCINMVLQRRMGIPLTLALVYSEVARRCGIELVGVNVPGHYFLTPVSEDLEFFIDVFEGGAVSFLEDAETTLTRIYAKPVKLDPAFLKRKQPLPVRTVLTRMLNNLKAVCHLVVVVFY
jgi:regulator of sirC expression with transglutaminase-like and TPR domain